MPTKREYKTKGHRGIAMPSCSIGLAPPAFTAPCRNQTDDAQAFYRSLGFRPQPEFWSRVSGSWLDNDANR